MDNIIKTAVDRYLTSSIPQPQEQRNIPGNQPPNDQQAGPSESNNSLSRVKTERKAENRLSNLLNGIRTNPSKINKKNAAGGKTRKVQIKWQRFDSKLGEYVFVRAKDGGESRFIEINEDACMEDIKTKAIKIYFEDNEKNLFGEYTDSIMFKIATSAGVDITNGGEKLSAFLTRKGLLVSKTYFVLKGMSFCNDNEYRDIESLAGAFQSSSSISQKKRICSVCNCTMDAGDECIICQQDRDYQNSLAIDSGELLSFDFPPFPESSTPSVVSEPSIPRAPGGESLFVPGFEPSIPHALSRESFVPEPSIPCISTGESSVPGAEPSTPCAPISEPDEELPDPTILRDRRCNHFDGSTNTNLVKRHKLTIKRGRIKESLIEKFKSDKV